MAKTPVAKDPTRNVWLQLGFPDAEEHYLKAELVFRHEWLHFRRSRLFHRSRAFQLSAGNHAALSAIDRIMNGARDSPISNGSLPGATWARPDGSGALPMNAGDQGKQKRRLLMPRSNRRFTGRLLKPIDLRKAKARGLRAQFALPPDESDRRAHFRGEVAARLPELKKLLGLPPDDRDPERLAKALIERELGIPRDAPNWWDLVAAYLTWDRVPGFRSGKRGHGAPRKWTPEQLMQLFADVEFRKKKTGQSVPKICKRLPTTKGYEERWGKRSPAALRKAYVMANKLRREYSLFLLELCGGEALMREKRVDLIEEAIKRHALRL